MANFDEALAFVLRNEDPRLTGIVTEDSGGRTRFGIAQRFHPDLGNFYTESAEVALDKAREIYRSDYWRSICGDQIADQTVVNKLLDMAVNMGVRQAVVLGQRALNAIGEPHLLEDGIMGRQTLLAINRCPPDELLQHLRDASATFYQHLAAVRPKTQAYLRGWLARARG